MTRLSLGEGCDGIGKGESGCNNGGQRRRWPNLWQPVEGDFGAHGEFDLRSKSSSRQLWFGMHPRLSLRLSLLLILLALGIVVRPYI